MVEGKLELFFPCKLGSKVQSNEVSHWILLFGKQKYIISSILPTFLLDAVF